MVIIFYLHNPIICNNPCVVSLQIIVGIKNKYGRNKPCRGACGQNKYGRKKPCRGACGPYQVRRDQRVSCTNTEMNRARDNEKLIPNSVTLLPHEVGAQARP
jgi:hypothetical protein